MTVRTHDRAAPLVAIEGWSLGAIVARLRQWREVARQRRDLARLSPQHLRDIGLDEEAAQAEVRRAFWDAPRDWRL